MKRAPEMKSVPTAPGAATELLSPDAARLLRGRSVSPELGHLWRAVEKLPWKSLAVVPADVASDARPVAEALVSTASLLMGQGPDLLDGTGLAPGRTASLILEMTHAIQPREHGIVVVLDPVLANDACAPVAIAADAVLLVTSLKEATFSGFRRTLEVLGRERIIGCITMRPGAGKSPPSPAAPPPPAASGRKR